MGPVKLCETRRATREGRKGRYAVQWARSLLSAFLRNSVSFLAITQLAAMEWRCRCAEGRDGAVLAVFRGLYRYLPTLSAPFTLFHCSAFLHILSGLSFCVSA